MSVFALVDCENFYASCERIFRPDLKYKPIVVLSSNDGCVIARSKEAKKLDKSNVVIVNSCGDAIKDKFIIQSRLGKKYG